MTIRALALGALVSSSLATTVVAQTTATLDEAVALALGRSPAVAAAAARTAEAEASYNIAGSALRPTIIASAYSNRLSESRLSPVAGPALSLYTRESLITLGGSQLLYDWGRATKARDAANLGRESQWLAFEGTKRETIYGVTQAFYNALGADELLRVAQDALARDQAFEALAAEFFRAGKTTRLDWLKAVAARVESERAHAAAQEERAVAGVRLAHAVGLDRGEIVPHGRLPQELTDPPNIDDLVDASLRGNADIASAARQVQQAGASLGAIRRSSMPEVALQGAVSYRERDLGGARPEWQVGIGVRWPLYTGGAISAQAAGAHARLAQAEETHRAITLAARSEAHAARAAWQNAQFAARSGMQIVATTREAVSAARALYEAGKATALDVLTAQADLARGEAAVAAALIDYAVARARVARLTGVDTTGSTR